MFYSFALTGLSLCYPTFSEAKQVNKFRLFTSTRYKLQIKNMFPKMGNCRSGQIHVIEVDFVCNEISTIQRLVVLYLNKTNIVFANTQAVQIFSHFHQVPLIEVPLYLFLEIQQMLANSINKQKSLHSDIVPTKGFGVVMASCMTQYSYQLSQIFPLDEVMEMWWVKMYPETNIFVVFL